MTAVSTATGGTTVAAAPIRSSGDGFGYGGEWARWNIRTFESDSYNDWWHDKPWRSYPRWTTQNLGCDKPWYSGDILRC